jgi:hypothetical protein
MFIGGKSPAASDTLPAPSNNTGVLAQPGINDLVVNVSAIWTFHEFSPSHFSRYRYLSFKLYYHKKKIEARLGNSNGEAQTG